MLSTVESDLGASQCVSAQGKTQRSVLAACYSYLVLTAGKPHERVTSIFLEGI